MPEYSLTKRITHIILGLLPAAVTLILWEIAARDSQSVRFFFSSPSQIFHTFQAGVYSGALIVDFLYTLLPTLIGFTVGVTFGTVLGFVLLSSETISSAAEWNVLVLGSIPIFAIAPMMLVWFGLGIEMKVAMAVLSTLFVALSHAYRGGRAAPVEFRRLFAANQADDRAVFWKLVLPMSLDWVFASLRLNANLALLGVFIGEFMASERGLGHAMLHAGSLYRVADVLAAAIAMIILVVLFDRSVALVERRRHRLIQWVAVDHKLSRVREK